MLIRNKSFYMFADAIAVVVSFILALLGRFASLDAGDFQLGNWYGCILMLFIYIVVILFYQPDQPIMKRNRWNELRVVITDNFYMVMVLTLILFAFKLGDNSSRKFYILFFLFNILTMYLGRITIKTALFRYYGKQENRKRLLICASDTNVLKVMNQVVNARLYDYDVSAIAVMHIHGKIELNQVGRNENGSYLWSDSDGLTEYLKKQVVDEALLSLPTMRREKLNDLIRRLEALGIVVHVTVNTFGMAEKEKAIENFGSYRVLTYSPRIFEPAELFLKRLMDIAGGLVGIIFTCILSIFVVPAIYLESPGPVIFKQTRIGRNGRRFSIYKFRSMYMDAEERKKDLMAQNQMDGLMFKMKDDPRITKVGKFIRKTSIDEFPQFFNVLKGDMSLVGTRPPTLDEFMQYEEHHKRRLSLKPGITGMWQVSGRSEIQNFEDVVKLDLEYIDNWSIWLDIKILLQTVLVVLMHRGAE